MTDLLTEAEDACARVVALAAGFADLAEDVAVTARRVPDLAEGIGWRAPSATMMRSVAHERGHEAARLVADLGEVATELRRHAAAAIERARLVSAVAAAAGAQFAEGVQTGRDVIADDRWPWSM